MLGWTVCLCRKWTKVHIPNDRNKRNFKYTNLRDEECPSVGKHILSWIMQGTLSFVNFFQFYGALGLENSVSLLMSQLNIRVIEKYYFVRNNLSKKRSSAGLLNIRDGGGGNEGFT